MCVLREELHGYILLLLLLLLLLNTPKLGAREKIKSTDREHQWSTGLYPVANRGLKDSWTDHWYTRIQPQEDDAEDRGVNTYHITNEVLKWRVESII